MGCISDPPPPPSPNRGVLNGVVVYSPSPLSSLTLPHHTGEGQFHSFSGFDDLEYPMVVLDGEPPLMIKASKEPGEGQRRVAGLGLSPMIPGSPGTS